MPPARGINPRQGGKKPFMGNAQGIEEARLCAAPAGPRKRGEEAGAKRSPG
jgi:hypothetical protein